MSAFERRLSLLDYIPRYPRKISTRELVNHLENLNLGDVSIRTVQRDLEQLYQMSVFGLEVDKRSKPHGWSINLNWKKFNIAIMDSNTALAFATLKDIGKNLLPSSTLAELQEYFDKAEKIIASEQAPLLSHWKRSVASSQSPLPFKIPQPNETVLNQIKQAILHKQQISAEIKRYLVINQAPMWKHYQHINPLGLLQQESGMTLVCSFGHFHQKIYKFPVSFIRNVEITEQASVIRDDFTLSKIANDSFSTNHTNEQIKLKLQIKKDCYFIIAECQFSENQTLKPTEYDDLLELTATVSDSPKLRAFLRGLGNMVEVLEPLALRDYFYQLAQQQVKKYQPKPAKQLTLKQVTNR